MRVYKNVHHFSVAIAALIILAYVVAYYANPSAEVFSSSSGIIYTNKDGATLVCKLSWDADISFLIDEAAQNNIPITFFVPVNWAKSNFDTLAKLKEAGFLTYPLTFSNNFEDLSKELNEGKKTGLDSGLFMPQNDNDASKLSRYSDRLIAQPVLCSFDLLPRSSQGVSIVKRMNYEWFEGAIIRFEPSKSVLSGLFDGCMAMVQRGISFQLLNKN